MPRIKIIARYTDGRLLKGTTDNFNPDVPVFHLTPVSDDVLAAPVEVVIRELKAVFVVHDFAGKPQHQEPKEFTETGPAMGVKLQVQFGDGETIIGRSMNFDLSGQGFFLFPADTQSNNQRIFVVSGAVKSINRVA